LVEVDDVNSVALTKNELLHLWIPTTGLVSKVNASLKHLSHSYDGHNFLLLRLSTHRSDAEATAGGRCA
jgi:hypothetical protein